MEDNETRGKIVEYIDGHVGASYSEILRALSLRNGTLSYHLYKLEKCGMIKSVRVGINKKFYPSGYKNVPINVRESIYIKVQSNPGITRSMIEKMLNLKRQVVSYHVDVMLKKGILHLKMDDGEAKLYANPKYADA